MTSTRRKENVLGDDLFFDELMIHVEYYMKFLVDVGLIIVVCWLIFFFLWTILVDSWLCLIDSWLILG